MSEKEQAGANSKEMLPELPSNQDASIDFVSQPKSLASYLQRGLQVFDRESKFALQVALIFVFSMQVGEFINQSLNKSLPSTVKVSVSDPVRTAPTKTALLVPASQTATIAKVKTQNVPVAQSPKSVQIAKAPLTVQRTSTSFVALRKPQSVSRNFASLPKSIRKTSARASSTPKKQADPILAVRQVLKQDYQISKATGSYEQHMKWVRKTLADYQKEG